MANPIKDAPALEVGHYAGILRRRWYVVLLGLIIGVALAVAYLQLATRQVTATATVRLNVISAEPFDTARPPSDLIDTQTEIATVTSSEVMSAVSDKLGGSRSTQQVRSHTAASLVQKTTVMRIRYTDANRALAEQGANDIAAQYLAYRGQLADARIQSIVTKLSDRRDALRDDLVAANTQQSNAAPGSGGRVQADSDRQLITIELNSVVGQINSFEGIDTTGGTVLVGAGDAAASISPSRRLVLGSGIGLGLILGLLGALATANIDRRLRSRVDVRKAGGGEVLSELDGATATLPATGADTDAIRSLRERLLATLPGESPILAVADLTRGPSDLGANLAYAFCETGRRVDLVMPGVSPSYLASVVAGFGLTDEGTTDGVHLYSGGTLDVLVPAEGSMPVAGEMFVADRLSDESRQTDLTVIALPPDVDRSQLLAAARLGHSLILVITRGSTSGDRVEELADELSAVGATVHGTVLSPRNRTLAPVGTVPAALPGPGSDALRELGDGRSAAVDTDDTDDTDHGVDGDADGDGDHDDDYGDAATDLEAARRS